MNLYIGYGKEDTFDSNSFENSFIDGLEKIADIISCYFTKLLGKEIAVCIKSVEQADSNIIAEDSSKQSIYNIEKDDMYLYTLCRSQNTNDDRKDLPRAIPKEGNTAIEKIFDENQRWYVCNNLKKEHNKRDGSGRRLYNNKTPNFLDYYKSTIVVPIRRKIRNKEFHVAAILAIDSNHNNTFSLLKMSQGNVFPYLLGAFADGLYLYIKLYKIIEMRYKK
jgi:hypothetical protein